MLLLKRKTKLALFPYRDKIPVTFSSTTFIVDRGSTKQARKRHVMISVNILKPLLTSFKTNILKI